MKLTSVFCLLSVAAAAKATKAQDDSSSDQSQDSQGSEQGYEAPAEQSYSAPSMAYSAPSYEAAAAPAYVAAPKCCVHECPSHAPFFSMAQCGCVAGVQYAAPAYAAASYAQPSYAAQQSYSGQQQQSGYRKLQSYGGQQQSVGSVAVHQPRGTLDTRTLHVTRTGRICLWIGFIILFLSAWTFINRALRYHFWGNHSDMNLRLSAFLSGPAMTEGFVCLIAALAYLTMATGHGYYNRCDGRQFYFARYIDWVLTTPLMLHSLVHFAGGSDDTFIYMFFMDILMIVAGLVASVVEDGFKWFFFAFAILTFIPVIYYICWLRSKVVDSRFDYALFFWNYSTMANLTAIAWFAYPIVWILCEGTSAVSADGEAIIYTVLDLISKALLGMFIISSRSIHTAVDNVMDLEKLAQSLQSGGFPTQ
jgi:bacteriorhodopsin